MLGIYQFNLCYTLQKTKKVNISHRYHSALYFCDALTGRHMYAFIFIPSCVTVMWYAIKWIELNRIWWQNSTIFNFFSQASQSRESNNCIVITSKSNKEIEKTYLLLNDISLGFCCDLIAIVVELSWTKILTIDLWHSTILTLVSKVVYPKKEVHLKKITSLVFYERQWLVLFCLNGSSFEEDNFTVTL